MFDKIIKWLGGSALALGLLITALPAQAGSEMQGGTFTAVDTGSTAVKSNAKGTVITAFIRGEAYDMVIALQVEQGSPGSGSWQTVPGFADIAPAANTTYKVEYSTSTPKSRYRLFVTTDTSGTAYYNIVSGRNEPTVVAFGDRSMMRVFDDFQHGTLPITTTHNGATGSYIVHDGGGTAVVLSVIEGEAEGVMTFSGGSAGTDADLSTGSFGLLTNGALVSSGLTAVEFRAHMSQITDANVGFGLVDVISAGTEIAPMEINSGVVAEGAATGSANVAVLYFDTDADVDQWHSGFNTANTIMVGEYDSGVAPVATTYQVLRIEIDSAGDATYYIDGSLIGAQDAAVATTAVLIPYWWAGSAQDATGTVNKIEVDYIDFVSTRPTGG